MSKLVRVAAHCAFGDAKKAIQAMTRGQLVDIDPGLVLRAARYELPPADSLIYAVAMRYDATLWMQDNDFEALLNVRYFAK